MIAQLRKVYWRSFSIAVLGAALAMIGLEKGGLIICVIGLLPAFVSGMALVFMTLKEAYSEIKFRRETSLFIFLCILGLWQFLSNK